MKIARLCSPVFLAGALALVINLSMPLPASADNRMNIDVISQQDPAWGASSLGTSASDTIGSSGCAITAVAMMLRYYGISTDPAALNSWLTANGGYAFDDQLIWNAVSAYTGGQVVLSGWTGPELPLIESELDAGRPVIAEVSLYGNQHFVLVVGYTSQSGLQINDPWFGDTVNFSDRYGDPASAIVSIRTFMPADGGDGPEPSVLAIRLSHRYLGQ